MRVSKTFLRRLPGFNRAAPILRSVISAGPRARCTLLCVLFAGASMAVCSAQGHAVPDVEWKRVNQAQATGTDQEYGAGRQPFTIWRSGGLLAFTTTRGIEGYLNGTERREVSNAEGVFTWLTARPTWCLQLTGCSIPEFQSMLQPVRYSKQTLAAYKTELQNALKMRVLSLQSSVLAGRPAFKLELAGRAAIGDKETVWIDSETGIILQQQDEHAGEMQYQSTITALKTEGAAAVDSFKVPVGCHIVRGLLSAASLPHLGANLSYSQFTSDLRKLAKSLGLGTGYWVRTVPELPHYTPVNTSHLAHAGIRNRSFRQAGGLSPPLLMPGGLPAGWGVSGELTQGEHDERPTLKVHFMGPEGQSMIISTLAPQKPGDSFSASIGIHTSGEPAKDINIAAVPFLAPDGALVVGFGRSVAEAGDLLDARMETAAGQYALVQSDFVDYATGDSLSLLQRRGQSLGPWLTAMAGRRQPAVTDAQLGSVQCYTMQQPYTANTVAWSSASANYALSATALSIAQLINLARQTAPVVSTTRP